MPTTPSFRPLWARFAAWLGFLAVFSALLAPVSMLAEEMRTGKLGGLCSVSASASGVAGDLSGDDGSAPSGAHCDMCCSLALGLPPLFRADVFPAPVTAMVVVFEDAVRSASSPGLPFSRGPPAL